MYVAPLKQTSIPTRTRISSDTDLQKGNWWHGPTWLTETKYFWPDNKLEVDAELSKLVAGGEKRFLFVSYLRKYLRFSKFDRLVRYEISSVEEIRTAKIPMLRMRKNPDELLAG